ncbi:FUSC family protein [Salinifilum ghardaiensis]
MAKASTAARAMWARITGTTEAGAPDPRQRQYAILVLCAVALGSALGWWLDATTPALIAALTAVLTLIAAGGQSLRSDLHRLSRFAPALVVVMACGPLLRGIPFAAGALVAVVIFGTGMLPALSERYRAGAQTVAAATLAATSGIGRDDPWWTLLCASAAGVVFALVLRVVTGLGDPTRATRLAVARTLLQPGPGVLEGAMAAWRTDGAPRWLGEVLAGLARFRAARETLLTRANRADRAEAARLRAIVDEADRVAAELARAVRARACTGLPPLARRDPVVAHGGYHGSLPHAVHGLNAGFDRIRAAVVNRSEDPVPVTAAGPWRERLRDAARAHLSTRSSLFRHALRCALAATIGMVVVALLDDPSASTLLLALYLVLQPAARDSMTGALERTGAAVLGVTALALVITLVPGALLLGPLLIAGMLLHVDQLRAHYQALLVCLIAVLAVEQTLLLDRPLVNVGIAFAANTAVGAAIALCIGFVGYLVLPSSALPDVRGAVRSTVWAMTDLLRGVRATAAEDSARDEWRALHVLTQRRTQDLLGMPALLDGTGERAAEDDSAAEAAAALEALRQDLAMLTLHGPERRAAAEPVLATVDELLSGRQSTSIPEVHGGGSVVVDALSGMLLENALHARTAVDRALGDGTPWKSYTITFLDNGQQEHLRLQ